MEYSEEVFDTRWIVGGSGQWCPQEECRLSRQLSDSGWARCLRSPRDTPTGPIPPAASWTRLSRESTLALVPGSAFAEGPSNWLGACGKTQIAVIIAESLWRSGAIDALIWISATNRASVLSGYVQASVAAIGIEPTGTAESVAARFVSWLGATNQPWLVVLDDLPGHGGSGRALARGAGRPGAGHQHAVLASPPRRRGTQVIPVGFFSVREALNCLTERLSVNPAQRQGAIDLIEALGREPLALAQAASVVANSTLACRDYRDYFARRRQQIGVAAGEVPSAAAVTWTLSLGQAESLLPGASVRLMLVLLALLDGHGIPGAIFSTPSVAAYLGGAVTPFSVGGRPEAGLGRAAGHRAGRADQRQPGRGAADDPDELGAPGGDQAGGARAASRTPRRGRPPARCWKPGRPTSRSRGRRTACG